MIAEMLNVEPAGSAGERTAGTMKAVRIHRRGGPDALAYENVPVPELRPGDALVRVHAAGISPAEFTWHLYETPDGGSPPEWAVGPAVTSLFFVVEPRRTQLIKLARLIDAGIVRPNVEAVLPLDRAREAYERAATGHPIGKLVLAVAGDDGGTSERT